MSESFIYDLNYETWLDSVMNGSVSIGFVSVHLNTDTVPMSATDGFGTYVEPNASIGYTPFVGPFWSITNSGGDATATTTEVFWELAVPAGHHDSIPITGWWAQDDATETLICGGSVSPPIVVHGSSATAIVVSPITLTLGNCAAPSPPPPPQGLSCNFGGPAGTPLESASMALGPGWVNYFGTLELTGLGSASAAATNVSANDFSTSCGIVAGTASVTVNAPAIGQISAGLILRNTQERTGYLCLVENDGGADYVGLFDCSLGSATVLQSVNTSIRGSHVLTAGQNGDTITVGLDGATLITYTAATKNPHSTECGLWHEYNGGYVSCSFSAFGFIPL